MSRLRCLAAVLAWLALLPAALAQGVTKPTLEKIREYRTVYVGHRESSPPFSYLDGDDVTGYSIDICRRLVETIRSQLDDPGLKVVMVPVTSSSRLLMLLSGVIDLECGSTTNTKIRQQQVAFGVTTFISGVKAVVRKDSGIERIGDLNGKVVVTTAGTTTERLVKTTLAARNATIRSKTARLHTESFGMVVARQADAFVLDDALLAGLMANSPESGALRLLEENFGFEPYGIAFRKNDPEFEKLVNDKLIEMMKSGEMEKLYAKWFNSPIPPGGASLGIPMSDMLREAFRNPSNAGI